MYPALANLHTLISVFVFNASKMLMSLASSLNCVIGKLALIVVNLILPIGIDTNFSDFSLINSSLFSICQTLDVAAESTTAEWTSWHLCVCCFLQFLVLLLVMLSVLETLVVGDWDCIIA